MPEWVWIQEVVFPLLGMGIGVFVLYNGFRIAKQSIDRHHERELAKSQGNPEALARLGERLEDLGYRLSELEERVDFTERVLAQGSERNRLGDGAT